MSRYKQFQNHQEIEVEQGVGLDFACCDCALVHDLQVRLENGKIFVSFTRDNRKTAALRRHYIVPMQARPIGQPRGRLVRAAKKSKSK